MARKTFNQGKNKIESRIWNLESGIWNLESGIKSFTVIATPSF
jgi:exonuclease VII small subunit